MSSQNRQPNRIPTSDTNNTNNRNTSRDSTDNNQNNNSNVQLPSEIRHMLEVMQVDSMPRLSAILSLTTDPNNSHQLTELSISSNSHQPLALGTSYDDTPICNLLNSKSHKENEFFDDYIDLAFENFFKESSNYGLFSETASRTQAIKILETKPHGSYIIRRKKDTARKPYVISIKVDDISINHLWIRVHCHEVEIQEEIQSVQPETLHPETEISNMQPSTEYTDPDGLPEDYDIVADEGLTENSEIGTLENATSQSKNAESIHLPAAEKTELANNSSESTVKNHNIWVERPQQQFRKKIERRHAYHIDSGGKMFKNLLSMLKFYEGVNLGDMFKSCEVTMKCHLNLNQFEYAENEEQIRLADDAGVEAESEESEIEDMEHQKSGNLNLNSTLDSQLQNSSDSLDTTQKNLSPTVTLLEDNSGYKFNQKIYKIQHKNLKMAYDWCKHQHENLKEDVHVIGNLKKGDEIDILVDEDQTAIDNNWILCYVKNQNSIKYCPKNFIEAF